MSTTDIVSSHPTPLPAGMELRPLVVHRDGRGSVAELFRQEWAVGVRPVQWTMISSYQGVLRGLHVHLRHDDYLTVLHGRLSLGVRDLRPGSPTEGHSALLELDGETLLAVVIPHGIAHGLYFHEPTIFVLGVSHYFDPADELGCHWADPALEIAWPVAVPNLSARDAGLPPLAVVQSRIPAWPA